LERSDVCYQCPSCGSDNCEERDRCITCLDCGAQFKVWMVKEGNKPCERCGGTGKLEIDIGVKPCHACCGSGLDVIAKSKKTLDYLANYTEKQVDD
jgi:DnaJ-class molecular chaperone